MKVRLLVRKRLGVFLEKFWKAVGLDEIDRTSYKSRRIHGEVVKKHFIVCMNIAKVPKDWRDALLYTYTMVNGRRKNMEVIDGLVF